MSLNTPIFSNTSANLQGLQSNPPVARIDTSRWHFTYPTDNLSDETIKLFEQERSTYSEPLRSAPSAWRHPYEFLRYLFLNSEFKKSGLESVNLETLLDLKENCGAFYEARSKKALLTAAWNQLLDPAFLIHKQTGPLVYHLKHNLSGKPLIELGAGQNIKYHRKLMRGFFGASRYIGVDQSSDIKRLGGIHKDMLKYLAEQPSASANVVAFGVMNEPVSLTLDLGRGFFLPAKSPSTAKRKHVEYEYIRRLAREIARVVPPYGIFWGAGLHSQSFEPEMRHALLAAGFQFDFRAHAMIEATPASQYYIRDPFFLVRK